jgi:hypothetical protein
MKRRERHYVARYRQTAIGRWDDPDFNRLSATPSAQLLLLYLEQSPHTTPIPCAFAVGRLALAERKRWSPEDFDTAFVELESLGYAKADWSAPLVYLPRSLHDFIARARRRP